MRTPILEGEGSHTSLNPMCSPVGQMFGEHYSFFSTTAKVLELCLLVALSKFVTDLILLSCDTAIMSYPISIRSMFVCPHHSLVIRFVGLDSYNLFRLQRQYICFRTSPAEPQFALYPTASSFHSTLEFASIPKHCPDGIVIILLNIKYCFNPET